MAITASAAARAARTASTEFAVGALPGEVRRRVEAVPDADRRFALVSATEAGATLQRRVTWSTWGDRFDLAWEPSAEGSTVHVTVTKRFPTALGDYGQGSRDLAVLRHLLGA